MRAVWAEADVASLAAALMVQRPPARARKDALLQVERLYYRLRIEYLKRIIAEAARHGTLLGALEQLCERSERYLAELQMLRERAALSEDETTVRLGATLPPSPRSQQTTLYTFLLQAICSQRSISRRCTSAEPQTSSLTL